MRDEFKKIHLHTGQTQDLGYRQLEIGRKLSFRHDFSGLGQGQQSNASFIGCQELADYDALRRGPDRLFRKHFKDWRRKVFEEWVGEASVFGLEILPRLSERLYTHEPAWSIAH
jgi:hypothetical protein